MANNIGVIDTQSVGNVSEHVRNDFQDNGDFFAPRRQRRNRDEAHDDQSHHSADECVRHAVRPTRRAGRKNRGDEDRTECSLVGHQRAFIHQSGQDQRQRHRHHDLPRPGPYPRDNKISQPHP